MKRSHVVVAIALAVLLGPAGCGSKSSRSSDSNSPSNATGSAPGQTAQSAQPVQPAPEPPPPPPPIVIPARTVVAVNLQQAVGSKSSQAGDSFAATLAQPIVVDGNVVVPKGANAYGTVTEAHAAGR